VPSCSNSFLDGILLLVIISSFFSLFVGLGELLWFLTAFDSPSGYAKCQRAW